MSESQSIPQGRAQAGDQARGYVSRLLDVFASSAQSFAVGDDVRFAWGRHIRDDKGDNTAQTGLHGSAQVVLAFAAADAKHWTAGRHEKYLAGGRKWLIDSFDHPNKPIDLRKTVKVGPLLGALSASGCELELIKRVAASVLAGRNSEAGGWGFDLNDPSEANPIPTIFALQGLVPAYTVDCVSGDIVSSALRFAMKSIPGIAQEDKRRACLYGLAPLVIAFDTVASEANDLLQQFIALLISDEMPPLSLLHQSFLDYRISTGANESTAYCTIQTGLLQLWISLWAVKRGMQLPFQKGSHQSRVSEFTELLKSPDDAPFPIVESCSIAIRILVEFSETAAESVAGVEDAQAIAAKAATFNPVSPYADVSLRALFYQKLLDGQDVGAVRVVQTLIGGWSEAYIDLCQLTDKSSSVLPFEVLKLDNKDDIEKEKNGATLAAKFLPPQSRVAMKDYAIDDASGMGVIRYDYAASKLSEGSIQPFLAFAEQSGSTDEVRTLLKQHYENMESIFNNRKLSFGSLLDARQFFEDQRKGTFWSSVVEGLQRLKNQGIVKGFEERHSRLFVGVPFAIVENIFHNSEMTQKAWKTPYEALDSPFGHGDHNPRNLLMVQQATRGAYIPVLIDYHRFGGPVPLALDFARLEVGVQIKMLKAEINGTAADEDAGRNLENFETTCNRQLSIDGELGGSSFMRGAAGLARAARICGQIRESFIAASGASDKYHLSYFAVLLHCYLSYLRPFYYSKLTSEQRAFSLFAACKLFERHFLNR